LPELDRVSRYYTSKGAKVVFLAVDYKESLASLKPLLAQVGPQLKVPLDSEGRVAERYMVQGFPTAFIIDRTGVIREKVVGSMDYDDIKLRLDALLSN
jgi:hypothetical protein